MTNDQILSAISSIDGNQASLRVRGYAIEELASKKQFEDVAYLLLEGKLPDKAEKEDFCEALRRGLTLDEESRFAIFSFQKNHPPLVGLRTFLSNLRFWGKAPENSLHAGAWIIGRLAACTAGFIRVSQGSSPLFPKPSESFAAQIFFLTFGRPPKNPEEKTLDRTLSIHSENGLNASTFSVRVTASTGADLISALCSGLATLIGPRHGGASVEVVKMLQEIKDPHQAKIWIQNALARKAKIPGFGHRVFTKEDPRALFLEEELRSLSRFNNTGSELAILQALVLELRKIKDLPRNIDFYAGPIFLALGFPPDFFPCLFAIGRTPGWIAHYREQVSKGRLIRPRATYVGPSPREILD